MRLRLVWLGCCLAMAACGDDKGKGGGGGGDAGADLSVGDLAGTTDDAGGEDGFMSMCQLTGEACATTAQCCTGTCDPTAHLCVSTGTNCMGAGLPCSVPTDCCNLSCGSNGLCGAVAACISDNQPCGGAIAGSCCGGTCGAGGTCTPLNTTCRTAGNACGVTDGGVGIPDGGANECCSGLCDSTHTCALASSFCTQPGDVCYRDGDCCTGLCNLATGATAGTCSTITSPAGCQVDGVRCNGCGACCSRLCAAYGASGVNICQPASGCHVFGDLCRQDSDCCGGEPKATMLPGAQLVKCTMLAPNLGYCDHPSAGNGGGHTCAPEGNVCHFLNYACNNSSARADCCACISGKECCKPDSLGVPRCNALGGDGGIGCVAPGGACTFNGDCCGGIPCVPDDTGALHCLTGTTCVPPGGLCSTTGDCCVGYTCIQEAGSIKGMCGIIGPPPPPPLDGGTVSTDMAQPPLMCSQIGQQCSDANPCCLGLTCSGTDGNACAGRTGCVCTGIVG